MKQKKLKRLLPPMLAAVLLFSACGGATSGERAQTTSAWNETEVTGMTTERTEPTKPSTELSTKPSAEPATKPATKPSAEPEDGEGFAWPDAVSYTHLTTPPRLFSSGLVCIMAEETEKRAGAVKEDIERLKKRSDP